MPSSVIRSYRYDWRRRALNIVFQSKRSYTYWDVPIEIQVGLEAAPSKGEFFNRHIRDKYRFTRDDGASVVLDKRARTFSTG
jgi:lysyl-tRNA synthetase class 2